MRKLLFIYLVFTAAAFAQNVRYTAPFPSVSATTQTPFLVANIPPNSPILAVCNSPANQVPCTNYRTTYTGAGVPCPNGAQDTPDPNATTSACQQTGDAQGNIGFWAPAGTLDYTVCIGINCYGPFTVTLGGSGGSGTVTHTGNLTSGLPVIGNGVADLTVGTKSGNTTSFATTTGSLTNGHCVQIDASGNLVDSGGVCGGGGNVSTTPAAGVNQNIVQQTGTTACINSDKSFNVCPAWNWTPQTPSGSLTAATPATATLTPCVNGWSAGIYASFNGYMHLDTAGTPEDVLITSATDCVANSQTVGFTPANNHANGYTIQSSTQGWQEAWNAARFKAPGGSVFNQGGVVRAQSSVSYMWTAPLVIGPGTAGVINNGTVDFSNSIIRCNVGNASCLQIGDVTNAHPELVDAVTILNFRGEPFVVNGTSCMMEDNGEGAKIYGTAARSPSTANAKFGYYICVDDDQAVDIGNISTLPALTGIRCDATFCGYVVRGGNGSQPNATVLWVHDSELSMQCQGNGIQNVAGNTMRLSNIVIQGFSQVGIQSAVGPGPNQLDNVYFEAGSCNNPVFGTPVQMGLMTATPTAIRGGEGPTGTLPIYANTGGTKYFYFVVFEDGSANLSTPFLAGTANSNGSGSINVKFIQPTTATKATLLRVSTNASNLFGAGNFLVGSASQLLSGICASQLCTITDTNAALGAYTVPSGNGNDSIKITYFPAMTFWPADIIFTRQNDTTNASADPADGVIMDLLSTGGSGAGLVSVWGDRQPTFYAHHCSVGYSNTSKTWQSCLAQIPGSATILQQGVASGGTTANKKGRINFGPRDADVPQHTFTLTDGNWEKTMAANGNRPSSDASDTWIGYDSFVGFSTGLAFGSGTGNTITNYIGNAGDGSNWLEQLGGALKTFKVPVTSTATLTGQTGVIGQGATGVAAQNAPLQVQDGTFGSAMSFNPGACETSFGATTLNVGGTTTDTGLNCLPATAIIDAVVYRITATITTAANFTIGDATTAARFCAAQAVLTLGTTGTCFVQADQTGAPGPRQTATAKVRVTTNVNPGAGIIRLVVYYHTWTPPTS